MTRLYFPEILDAGAAAPAEIARSLSDLRRINRWLGGRRVLLEMLEKEVRRARLTRFSFLDVGAGSGDLGEAVKLRFPESRVVICDLKPQHLPGAGSDCVAASAEALPFSDASFDFVSASLLLHHFRDPEAVRLLKHFGRIARRAVLVNDLERHWFPAVFFRMSGPVFARSYVTRHDGVASILKSFLPHELAAMALAAGFSDIIVRRHLPWFRISLVARNRWGQSCLRVLLPDERP